jgi:hypothetical protein
MKLLILAKFHVFASNGEGKKATRFDYAPGMVVDSDDMPEDQSAESWLDKGLAAEASVKGDPPTESGAPAAPTP